MKDKEKRYSLNLDVWMFYSEMEMGKNDIPQIGLPRVPVLILLGRSLPSRIL
jgi:hypothetical protein